MKNVDRLTLSVREVAEALGASQASIWRWIKQRELPATKVGGRVLIPRDALRRRLEQSNQQDSIHGENENEE